jgi:hypothetical protein
VNAVTLDQVAWRDRRGRSVRLELVGGALVAIPTWRGGPRQWVVWATGKSQYLISKILNALFNATAYAFPATSYHALWTSPLTAASTGATAGEASYTGYARVAVAANVGNFPLSAAGSAITNATAITWPSNAGVLNTVTYYAILDAATVGTGNVLYWGSVTSTDINPGNTPQVAISALTVTET